MICVLLLNSTQKNKNSMNRTEALKILVNYAKLYGEQPSGDTFEYMCEESGRVYYLNDLWEIIQAERGELIHLRYKPKRNRRKKFN
jgi:hypothetical protein